jgi:CYTH domain-containing protein
MRALRLRSPRDTPQTISRELPEHPPLLPDRVTRTFEIVDRYISRTRLRLRELRDEDGRVTRKLGHKVRLSGGPAEVACTNMYLNEQEWDLLSSLPARLLRKQRHVVQHDGLTVALDEYDDGTLVAEIDDRDQPAQSVPAWLTVVADVSDDEQWTGCSARALSHRTPGIDTRTAADPSFRCLTLRGISPEVWPPAGVACAG